MNPALLLALAFAAALTAGGKLLLWQQSRAQDSGSLFKLLLGVDPKKSYKDKVGDVDLR